ncbi:hypothetical protein EDF56_107187 [Novosphingobium sp. PhB165]|uniref:hypothetical protein n=1 Tax=Novosphingobium sp. PhB165 TaxID=2485105 RepID=UPI0010514F25|nr:hypothetical protein [Novosphingobium sp. PhB165]TCM16608.1 hypothetical protein EDF56_107187 [Novosphingobium sp. PhB165]
MFRSVTKKGGYEVSGDLPGATMRLLENAGSAPVVLWAPGAEGDQLPLFKSQQRAVGNLPAVDQGAAGWGVLDVQAQRLAQAVNDVPVHMRPAKRDTIIAADTGTVACPGQTWPYDLATNSFGRPPVPQADVTIPLTWLRIDDFVLAGIGGDLGSMIGSKVRNAMPQANSMVMTLTAGQVGYILPDEAYAKPGHGIYASHLKPGCAAPALVSAFRKFGGGK